MRLQKAPEGLLGALELKTLGQNPNAFGDTVVPFFDVAGFYGLPNTLTTSALSSNVVAVASFAAAITVPDGEVWRLRYGGFTLEGFTAGDSAWAALAMARTTSPVVPLLQMPAPVLAVATDVLFFGGRLELLIPPGTRVFTTLMRAPGAGSIDITTRLWYEAYSA